MGFDSPPRVAGCVCMKQRNFSSNWAALKSPHAWAELKQIYSNAMELELPPAPGSHLPCVHPGDGPELTRVAGAEGKLSCKQVAVLCKHF